MSLSEDFAVALARAYDLMGQNPPHHPAVRVAVAEVMALLEGGHVVVLAVTPEGLVSDQGTAVPGTEALAHTLSGQGVERLEMDADITSEELESLLARARRWAEERTRRATLAAEDAAGSGSDAPDGEQARIYPSLARSVAALFGGVDPESVPLAADERPEEPRDAPPDPPPTDFAEAVEQYVRRPDGGLTELVVELAAKEEPSPVARAVEALIRAADRRAADPRVALARRLASPPVLSEISSWLADAEEASRQQELGWLAVGLGKPMARVLAAALENARDRGVRRILMEALVMFGPAAREAVEVMIRDRRWFVVRNGVRLLPDVSGRAAAEGLGEALEHPDPRVRQEALLGLARVGGSLAAELAGEALADPDPFVRAAAATALGVLGGADAGPRLLDCLGAEREPEVLSSLAGALGRLGYDPALPHLERIAAARFFSRAPKEVRISALQALWTLGSQPARSVVMEALEDRDPDVRGSVRALLGGR